MAGKKLKDGLDSIVNELVRSGISLAQAREEFERQFISATLLSNGGNLCRSARSLGVHRNTLRNKVTSLGISIPSRGPRSKTRGE